MLYHQYLTTNEYHSISNILNKYYIFHILNNCYIFNIFQQVTKNDRTSYCPCKKTIDFTAENKKIGVKLEKPYIWNLLVMYPKKMYNNMAYIVTNSTGLSNLRLEWRLTERSKSYRSNIILKNINIITIVFQFNLIFIMQVNCPNKVKQ